jgi:hypothetical protein
MYYLFTHIHCFALPKCLRTLEIAKSARDAAPATHLRARGSPLPSISTPNVWARRGRDSTQPHPHRRAACLPLPSLSFSNYSPVPSLQVFVALPAPRSLSSAPLDATPRLASSRLVSSRSPPPAARGAATAEAKGEERGAMRMLSRACSVVASSLPRCSSSVAAPTVASLSPSLPPRVLPFPRDRKVVDRGGLDLGPVSFHRSASPWPAIASVRAQQHWRFLHARPSFACLVIAGTHSCLLIPVP